MTIYTTIRISLETKEALDKFGNKGETYDEIVKRIIRLAILGGNIERNDQ